MATGNSAAMQAMGALQDSFALGLLEAWCQLQTITEQVLLIVYDEAMPERLLPDYHWHACAFALLLARPARHSTPLPLLHRPQQATSTSPNSQTTSQPANTETTNFPLRNPALAAAPLIRALLQPGDHARQTLALSTGPRPWIVDLEWQ